MSVPAWVKPALWGAVVGGVGLAIVAFSAGWVVTASKAEQMARSQSEKAVVEALLPICIVTAKADPEYEVRLAALDSASYWTRGDKLESFGWATMAGSSEPNDELASACVTALLKKET